MKLNLLTLWFSVNMLSVILAVSAIEQDSVTILQGFIWACVSLVSIALVIRPINRLIEKEEAEKQANRKGVAYKTNEKRTNHITKRENAVYKLKGEMKDEIIRNKTKQLSGN